MAEFAGSAVYGGSSDSTYITVGPAVSAAQPIETEEPTARAHESEEDFTGQFYLLKNV